MYCVETSAVNKRAVGLGVETGIEGRISGRERKEFWEGVRSRIYSEGKDDIGSC